MPYPNTATHITGHRLSRSGIGGKSILIVECGLRIAFSLFIVARNRNKKSGRVRRIFLLLHKLLEIR